MGVFALKNQWIKTCTGVELQVLPDNSFSCRYCSASIKGQALTIVAKGEGHGQLEAIAKKLPAGIPLSVTITGKGVLIKKISITGAQTMSSVFPNFKAEDFYEQSYISGDSRYIAIVRKQTADKIIYALNAGGQSVVMVTLGPFAVSHIQPQLNLYGEELQFDGHRISVRGGSWASYQYVDGAVAQFPVKIETEVISERLILAYAAAFQLCLSHLLEPIQASVSDTSAAYAEFIEKRKFQFRSVMMLGLLFILLLFNFFIFNYFSERNERLSAQLKVNSTASRNSESSLQQVKAKKILVQDLGWYKGIPLTYVLDQIGQTVPSAIKLTLLKTMSGDDATDRTIHIQGITRELRSVNEWIYRLQEKGWVEKVTLDNFRPSEPSDEQVFNLRLTY